MDPNVSGIVGSDGVAWAPARGLCNEEPCELLGSVALMYAGSPSRSFGPMAVLIEGVPWFEGFRFSSLADMVCIDDLSTTASCEES